MTMHPRIADYLRWKYPGIDLLTDVRLRSDGEGMPPVLEEWTLADSPPDEAEVEAALPQVDSALAAANRVLVSKYKIVDRLIAAGLLAAARGALDAQPLDVQEKWNARTDIYADDPTALALLAAIGADPAVILAP